MLAQNGNSLANGNGALPTLEITARVLWSLANAATWDDTYRVLVAHQATLLSDRAFALLHLLIEDMLSADEVADAKNWRQYRSLLEKVHAEGIDSAWKDFITSQNEAVEALDELTSAVTPTARYSVLENRQAALLSDAAFVILRGSSVRQHNEGNTRLAQYLERLLQLLEYARTRGIKVAWERFEEAGE